MDLKQFETKAVAFTSNQAAPVLRKREVLMTSKAWGNNYILPSKSNLEFDFKREAYTASAQVANLTSRYIKEHVFATFATSEVVSDYEYHPITQESQKLALQRIKTQPPAREVFPSTNKQRGFKSIWQEPIKCPTLGQLTSLLI